MNGRSIAVLAAVLTLGMAPSPAAAEAKTVYTKYNIHLQCRPDRDGDMRCEGSYANWTDPGEGHFVVPVNSRVRPQRGRGRGVTLIIQDPAAAKVPTGKIEIEFDAGRMKMSADQYVDLITSSEPVPVSDFSEKDQEGIAKGKALPGMSKKGVLAALGYPAAHYTPSLEGDTYYYWKNRFMKTRVDFNEKGIVVSVD